MTLFIAFLNRSDDSEQFGVKNIQKLPKLTEKLNIFILLVATMVTAENLRRNQYQLPKNIISILCSRQ